MFRQNLEAETPEESEEEVHIPGLDKLKKEKELIMRQIWHGQRKLPPNYTINGKKFTHNEPTTKQPTFGGGRKPSEAEQKQNFKRNSEWKLDFKSIVGQAKNVGST